MDHRLLHVQSLISAFTELSHVQLSASSVMQTLFLCTGCDFVLVFEGIGKASFMATLFQYCDFICANNELLPGTLEFSDTDSNAHGKLAFLRLVGCAYLRKHKSVFLPAYPSPVTLYNSLTKNGQSPLAHHSAWLADIRDRIWSKIKYEEEMIPSDGALARHWMRSCWVLGTSQQ